MLQFKIFRPIALSGRIGRTRKRSNIRNYAKPGYTSLFQALGEWKLVETIEKMGGRRARFGKESLLSPFLSRIPLVPDPARRSPARFFDRPDWLRARLKTLG